MVAVLIGVDAGNFWSIMQAKVDVWRDVGNSIVKSKAVFGVICTFVALYQGPRDRRDARGVAYANHAHRGDRRTGGAGRGLHPHGADVPDAGQQGTRDGQERRRNPGRLFVLLGMLGLVFLALKAANLTASAAATPAR